jgi:hypothetical protein
VTKSTHNKQQEFQHQALIDAGVADPTMFDTMIPLWWRNPTNHNSLRLTVQGFRYFVKKLSIKSYSVELSTILTFKHLLQLERLFQAPYYIQNKTLVVFSEQDAVMLQLHAGNLAQYLDNLQSNG